MVALAAVEGVRAVSDGVLLRCRVGNDVVDVLEPRTRGKAHDDRFVGRVFAPSEQEEIRRGRDPDRELWIRWAAKEAAYKAVSKLLGTPPVFAHARFVVGSLERTDLDGASWVDSGQVGYGSIRIPVVVMSHADVVHAVARVHPSDGGPPPPTTEIRTGLERLDAPGRPWTRPLDELMGDLSPREADAVHGQASAAVRLAARAHLAGEMGVEEGRLAITAEPGTPGRRPPVVLLDGEPAAADVSLSHDGAWIAWALHVAGPAS